MTSRDIMVEANRLIQDNPIVRRSFAVDSEGRPCSHMLDKAVAFCPTGALVRAAYNLGAIPSSELCPPLRRAMRRFAFIAVIPEGMHITQWSDVVSDEQIRGAFMEAALIEDVSIEADQLALSA